MSENLANEIKRQLFAGDKMVPFSWGINTFVALNAFDEFLGGLTFKVQGAYFEGVVIIGLAPDDTYTVMFYKGRPIREVNRMTGVYCDQLTDMIDKYVEKP